MVRTEQNESAYSFPGQITITASGRSKKPKQNPVLDVKLSENYNEMYRTY
jgi:hypothetical protein